MSKQHKPQYQPSDQEFDESLQKGLLEKYKCNYWKQATSATCDFVSLSAQAQQLFVTEYFNIGNPSRGICIWHGLGSGKTCSAIFISNHMRKYKDVCVITPAMLRDNFIKELEVCGYKSLSPKVPAAAAATTSREIWEVNPDEYTFISSNGKLNKVTPEIFASIHGKLVIIDESQILFSKINNALKKGDPMNSFVQFYEYMLHRQDIKVVCLSGTPMETSTNELYLLLNILNGSRPRFSISRSELGQIQTVAQFQQYLQQGISSDVAPVAEVQSQANPFAELLRMIDFQQSSVTDTEIILCKNPYGYVNAFESTPEMLVYMGVVYSKDYSKMEKDDLVDDRMCSNTAIPPIFLQHLKRVAKSAQFKDFLIPFPIEYKNTKKRKATDATEKEASEMYIRNTFNHAPATISTSGAEFQLKRDATGMDALNAYTTTSQIRRGQLVASDDIWANFRRSIKGKVSFFGNVASLLPSVKQIEAEPGMYYGASNSGELLYYIDNIDMTVTEYSTNEQRRIVSSFLGKKELNESLLDKFFKRIFSANIRQFCYNESDYKSVKTIFIAQWEKFKETEKYKDDQLIVAMQFPNRKRIVGPFTQEQDAIATVSPPLVEWCNNTAKIAMNNTLMEYIWKDAYRENEKVDSQFAEQLKIGQLQNRSVKIYRILRKIMENRTDLHILFSQNYQVNIPLARILNANGFTEFTVRDIGSPSNQPRYLFLTGDGDDADDNTNTNPFFCKHSVRVGQGTKESDTEGHTLKVDKQRLIDAFNSLENRDGQLCQIVILNTAAAEGITLKRVHYVHLLQNPFNMSKMYQIIGRAIRNCTHRDVEDKTVLATLYLYDDATDTDHSEIEKYEENVRSNDRLLPLLSAVKQEAIDATLNDKITDGTCSDDLVRKISLDIDANLSKKKKTAKIQDLPNPNPKIKTAKISNSASNPKKSKIAKSPSPSSSNGQTKRKFKNGRKPPTKRRRTTGTPPSPP